MDTISEPIYDTELYVGIYNKVAALAWKIIEGHVFNDANKRTGMHAGLVLMKLNFAPIHAHPDSIKDIAVSVGSGECTIEELGVWFYQHAI